jgi:ankyrin repeat protein
VNFKSSSGPSALMLAVGDCLPDITKYLLEVGADPNIPDHVSMTLALALHIRLLILLLSCNEVP